MRTGLLLLAISLGATTALAADSRVLTGPAAFGDWSDRRAGRAPADHAGRYAPALRHPLGRQFPAARAANAGRPAAGAAGLRRRSLRRRVLTSRASSARPRTATSSSPRAARGACSCFAPTRRARRLLTARSSPPTCRASSASPSIPSGPDPRLVYVATPGAVRAIPIAAATSRRPARPRLSSATCRPAAGIGRATRLLARRQDDVRLGRLGDQRRRRHDGRSPSHPARRLVGTGSATGPTCSPSTRTAATSASSRPASGTARAWPSSRPAATLWCAVNERDGLGDNLPPDYATHVVEGAFYGWPWYYIGAHEDPRHKGERPDLADKVTVPDVLFKPTPLRSGSRSTRAGNFPPNTRATPSSRSTARGTATKRTGYKVVRLLMKDGKPTGVYEDFLTGFVADPAGVWGRPVDVAATKDGALLVTDDERGAIWRVAYRGKP